MLLGAGAVADETLAPLIEDIAPWIAVTGGDEVPHFHRARIDHVCSRESSCCGTGPRAFRAWWTWTTPSSM